VEYWKTETFTSDGTSGISYNFWDSNNFTTPLQLTDNDVPPPLSQLSISVVKDVELLKDTKRKDDKHIREFKNIKPTDIQHIKPGESFRCYSSTIETVRFRRNGGVEKKIAGRETGSFRFKNNLIKHSKNL
jgi:hypothetical protein